MSEFPSLSSIQFQKAIREISDHELNQKKQQQLVFIFKLIETNNELKLELKKPDITNEDQDLYNDIINENKLSLFEQIGRIENLNNELVNRGLLNEIEKDNEEEKMMKDIEELSKKGDELEED
ncbi:uncharacterized protein KGF55_000963 [Candida pseudojiufengensis]|uniref:uncharacterized protein n=1 Tax=Candida pseudojiufengensis TaxID=497109 RepID=UPI0022251818|nr:uncharacterized protein KGF55_000963 [Candida pseudojiufengensis]KAI5965601.1 hypothetical protein KGF55_000963 [Candida pseudojiufengensis]